MLAHKQSGQAKNIVCTGTQKQGYLLFLIPTLSQWRQITVYSANQVALLTTPFQFMSGCSFVFAPHQASGILQRTAFALVRGEGRPHPVGRHLAGLAGCVARSVAAARRGGSNRFRNRQDRCRHIGWGTHQFWADRWLPPPWRWRRCGASCHAHLRDLNIFGAGSLGCRMRRSRASRCCSWACSGMAFPRPIFCRGSALRKTWLVLSKETRPRWTFARTWRERARRSSTYRR